MKSSHKKKQNNTFYKAKNICIACVLPEIHDQYYCDDIGAFELRASLRKRFIKIPKEKIGIWTFLGGLRPPVGKKYIVSGLSGPDFKKARL